MEKGPRFESRSPETARSLVTQANCQLLIANCQWLVPTPPFPLRGTSYISCLTHTGTDHSFRLWLARAPLAAARCSHSIPPCVPVPALFSCDVETALPNRPSMSTPAFSAAATPAAAGRHSTHPPPLLPAS